MRMRRYRIAMMGLFLFVIGICIAAPSIAPTAAADVAASAPITASQSPAQLDQQGKDYYAARQFSQAAAAFRQAAQIYQTQGNVLQQAISLSNLSLCEQQLGSWQTATDAIATSLHLLQHPANTSEKLAFAQALDIQGNLNLAQGQAEAALQNWQQSADFYTQIGKLDRAIASQVNQAQALQDLGRHRQAIALLSNLLALDLQSTPSPTTLQSRFNTLPKTPTTLAALQSLGEALRLTGNLEQSQILLQQALKQAEQEQNNPAIAAIKLKLGNLLRTEAIATLSLNNLSIRKAVELIEQSKQNRQFRGTNIALAFDRQLQTALLLYKKADQFNASSVTRIQSNLNQLSIRIDLKNWSQAQLLVSSLQKNLNQLPLGKTRLDAQLNLAQNLQKMIAEGDRADRLMIAQLLSNTAQQAKQLRYARAESYALGMLGHLYEQSAQWQDAQGVTQTALLLAQTSQAPEISYLWQWQLGRLAAAQGNGAAAIAAYQEAVSTLTAVRKELVAAPLTEQFFFRDTIEPIHRELVALLLDPKDSGQTPTHPDRLKAAREVIESLQLTELVNFFREDCLVAKPKQIDQIDATSAVLYPIILPNRIALIASLPGQTLKYYSTPATEVISEQQIESMSNQLRLALKQANTPMSEILPSAQTFYDWLIRPIQADLTKHNVKTLVFVLDGVLRNIPMSVLHDREHNQYLIEQYSIALTPGLQLLPASPLARHSLSVLIGGLTQARSGFSALPNVETELQQVKSQVANSKILIDDRFTSRELQSDVQVSPFPIVHLATHGQFSSQLENTFILTWDSRLTINQLRTILQSTNLNQNAPLELLVLSACETAAGDNRATLGLAGIAIRAGARSTLATLWQVSDASSVALMQKFYQELTRSRVGKSEALRRAQLSLLQNPQNSDYQHPYYWAPYVLVGNWT